MDDLVGAARYHRIAPLAHVALRGVRPDLAEPLRVDRDTVIVRHSRMLAALREIETVLGDLPWLTFKGPVLSELAHPVSGLRSYKDLDILVDPLDLREAHERLNAVGWNVIDSNETLERPELSGEVRLASSRRILVDLHWSMVVNVSRRQRFPISTPMLLRRRRRVQAGLAPLWALDPTDALLHVCLHAALSGGTRLLHLIDADQLARDIDDWDLVAIRAKEWRSTAQTALVLGRARRLLGTPLPADLYPMLGLSSVLRPALSTVDRRWPTEMLHKDESLPRLVARAVQPTARGTLAWALHNSAVGVFNRTRRAPVPPPRIPADPSKIDQYMSAVESTVRGVDLRSP
ncbi:nucleotidyltransferase family protein [Microlunatus aurantiacus]|uniref:nucleotidyltransferase domain-containing protein n=1 Tax=Microlunatus aurantiacus TaxID=446786 RepID=UPI0031DD3C08